MDNALPAAAAEGADGFVFKTDDANAFFAEGGGGGIKSSESELKLSATCIFFEEETAGDGGEEEAWPPLLGGVDEKELLAELISLSLPLLLGMPGNVCDSILLLREKLGEVSKDIADSTLL